MAVLFCVIIKAINIFNSQGLKQCQEIVEKAFKTDRDMPR